MIDALKRKLGMIPTAPVAETEKEPETMDNQDVVTPTAETVDAVALQATLEATVAELSTANAKVAELTALVEAAVAFNAEREKAALDTKLAARAAKVEAAIGTEKAPALSAALAGMEDSAFDAVLAAMTVKASAEADTALFKEVGVDATADTSKLVQGQSVMDYLTSKYPPKA